VFVVLEETTMLVDYDAVAHLSIETKLRKLRTRAALSMEVSLSYYR